MPFPTSWRLFPDSFQRAGDFFSARRQAANHDGASWESDPLTFTSFLRLCIFRVLTLYIQLFTCSRDIKKSITVKPDVPLNIAILLGILQFLLWLRLLWASCNRRNQIASWKSICSEYLIGSSLLLVTNQRLCLQILVVNFNLQFLITSVATCSEQSRNQNCNIPNNIAIFRETEHPVWL